MNSPTGVPAPPKPKGMTLPEPVFPQHPELVSDPGPETIPDHRDWTSAQIWRKVRGWLIPYIRSRVMPGGFHPITAYLFSTTSATLIVGIAGLITTRLKE